VKIAHFSERNDTDSITPGLRTEHIILNTVTRRKSDDRIVIVFDIIIETV
jgi:hypothetical protein